MKQNEYKKNKNKKREYEKSESVKMINPYTFVPVKKDQRINAEEYYGNADELQTGVLHCTLQVRTPLAIPDSEEGSGEDGEHQTYPFYKINGQYAIPGSSIRGVLRSTFETITDSCFSTMKDNTYLSKREEAKHAYKPGILKKLGNDKFVLYTADRYLIPVSNSGYTKLDSVDSAECFEIKEDKGGTRKIKIDGKFYKTGDWVDFYYKDSEYNFWEGIVTNKKSGGQPKHGILYIGEKISRKHGESIFVEGSEVESSSSNWQKSLDKAYDRLQETKKFYQNKSVNKDYGKSHNGYADFENLNLKEGIPIWYKVSDEEVYFSYASIGRTTYKRTLNEVSGMQPCSDRRKLCEGCLLFGMIGSDKEDKGIGSRIRVSDALLSKLSDTKTGYVPLKELGEPRNSYLPFYAKYNGSKKGEIPSNYDDKDVEIAGRKYYWHHKEANKTDSDYKGDKTNKRSSTMELINPGAEFEFEIYYDGIKEEQLKKLVWTITLGDNKADSSHCHKIGHGKPLGLGSVKITIKENIVRTFDENEYKFNNGIIYESCVDLKNMTGINGKAVDAILKVTDLEEPLQNEDSDLIIDYPNIYSREGNPIPLAYQQARGHNKAARHQWYSQNRNEKSPQKLSDIMDDEQGLMPYLYLKYPPVEFKEGIKYKAKVLSYNKQKTSVYILVKGEKGSMYFKDIGAEYGKVDKMFPVGTELTVEYINSSDGGNHLNFIPCN